MAQPIPCDNEDGNLAALLVTNLGNGDTIALCQPCIPLWASALLSEFGAVESAPAPVPAHADGDDAGEGEAQASPFRPEVVAAEPEAAPTGPDDTQPSPAPGDAAEH